MDTCRCEEFDKIAENIRAWVPGSIHLIQKIKCVPDNAVLKWKKTFEDPLSTYPAVSEIYKPTMCSATTTPHMCLETKWIPVDPCLVSLRLVNQCRTLKDSPLY
ncbi:uncharacterized protein LOC108737375 [Agrilus planipennis]|uniref:Uncharacterized protein LOC108737375 n=1 Tax=Agrilus planipennis TaxID=224129 RepID=A0A1W4WYV2_AGRPL|nr:uncharacterized protein LOC108737375 [Agrilus planipennis]